MNTNNYDKLSHDQQIIHDLEKLTKNYELLRAMGIHMDTAKVFKSIDRILTKDRTLGWVMGRPEAESL